MSDVDLHNQCEICGEQNPKTLHTHHVVPEGKGGRDIPENRVKLCANCHNAVHKIYDEAYYERLQSAVGGLEVDTADGSLGYEIRGDTTKDRQLPSDCPHVRTHVISATHDVAEMVYEDYDTNDDDEVRIHTCGYCDVVFDVREHANIATHLQREHGVSDPYQPDNRVKLPEEVVVEYPDDVGVDEPVPWEMGEGESPIKSADLSDMDFGADDPEEAQRRGNVLIEWVAGNDG